MCSEYSLLHVGSHGMLEQSFATNLVVSNSCPLYIKIIFPKIDENVDANLENKPIKQTACVFETPNGDLNSLSIVLEWIKAFAWLVHNRHGRRASKLVMFAYYQRVEGIAWF